MSFTARLVVSGLTRPVFACAPVGDQSRLFIVEQEGRIRILDLTSAPPALRPIPFLQITGLSTGNEQGLLGLAFHPKYATNRTFFVNFTDTAGTTVIARYTVPAGTPDVADAASFQVVLKVPQPFANHNGGWLGFGPDGFLYVSLGDGGSGNDPGNRAQNRGELLGKLLRLDVDGDDFPADPNRNYAIPTTNPFVNVAGARPEIWAYGLRNPWRCSFDRSTDELYIADVGQDDREEVNVQPKGQGGQNYGWRLREGLHDTGLGVISGVSLTDPVHEYDHGEGIAIVGGYVYRGNKVPELNGAYFFADHTGPIWTFRYVGGVATQVTSVTSTLFPTGEPSSITSFAEDAAGEIYLLNRSPGTIYRIDTVAVPVAAPTATPFKQKLAPAVNSVTWGKPKTLKSVNGEVPKSMLEMTSATADVQEPSAPGTPVEEARALLQAAAAIEHSLLLQYLYAAYSLDRLSPGYALAGTLVSIAIEEMGHLITVQNLLLAIGGEAYLARESPKPQNDPFPFRLQPLGLTSLAKYVTTESPLEEQLAKKNPNKLARAKPAYSLAETVSSVGNGVATPGINHVGVLYAKLYWLFQSGDATEGPWKDCPPGPFASGHILESDFVSAVDHQISADEIGSSSPGEHSAYVAPVTNRAEALDAIYQIAAQGEGWADDNGDDSHFERFLKAFEEYARFVDAGDEPTLPVPTNPTTGNAPTTDRNRITHPSSKLWAELCDVRYQMSIGELWLAILLPANDPSNPRLKLFKKSRVIEMKKGIAMIARKLAALPRSESASAITRSAGALFRMPSFADLPSDVNGWKQFLRDRVVATAQLRSRLESAENTIPLEPNDVSQILNPLQLSDVELLNLLGP